MSLFVKTVLVALVSMMCGMLFAMPDHCNEDHEVPSAQECDCVCCCESGLTSLEQAGGVTANQPKIIHFLGVFFNGRLAVADVYRPPIST